MCTVTFVPTNKGILITSNRDEDIKRGKALHPQKYIGKHKTCIFPKDSKAHGTWFAHDEASNCIVLLNGADEKHKQKTNYRKSRGIILLDIFDSENPLKNWQEINLQEIEPFTLILFFSRRLYELKWNEREKKIQELSILKPHIWSSVTLYDDKTRKLRANLFFEHVKNEKDVLSFHQYKDDKNPEYSITIERNQNLKTVSITQLSISKDNHLLTYLDLIE